MVYHLTVAGKWRKIIGIYNSEWRRYRARLQAARVAAQGPDLVRRLRGGDLVRLLDDIDMDRPAST